MAEFYVEQHGWAHWPKVLIMCRKNGRDVTRRRYVQEVETGEGVSITDELREYAWQHMTNNQEIRAIADRIDAEHKMACDDAWDNGYEADYLGIEKWLTEHPQVMEHHGWIRLPKDADGEYIHIGDVMAYADNTKPMAVTALVPPAVFLTENGPRYADMCRHYHAPTVEDVLREFGIDWEHESDCEDRAALLAEYAAKLRLREDA